MAAGRPRKPYRLRILEGGRGKSRALTPDLPAPSSPLVAPAGLSRPERRAWNEHVEYFRDMGIESKVDSAYVEGMIRMLCRGREADAILHKSGLTMISVKGNRVKRPEVSISRESWEAYRQAAGNMGIGAAARAKLGGDGGHRERAGDLPEELRRAKRR